MINATVLRAAFALQFIVLLLWAYVPIILFYILQSDVLTFMISRKTLHSGNPMGQPGEGGMGMEGGVS